MKSALFLERNILKIKTENENFKIQYLRYHSQNLFGQNMKQFQYIHVKNVSQGPLSKTCYTKTRVNEYKQDHGSLNFMYVLIYLLQFVFKNIEAIILLF